MRPAILGLQIVAWVMVPYTLTNTLAQILFASGNQVLDLRVNLMSTIANVLLNLALIPRWGFIGASAAAVGSMCFHVTLQYTYVRTRVHDPKVLGSFARIGGAAAVAFATILLLAARHPIVALFAGLACYAAALRIVGILRGEHLRWLLREGRDLGRGMLAAALALTHRSVAPKET
jgi:O-antigen/teichoic acid export membrane protein